MTRSILSAGAEDADILFEDELRCLSEERKEKVIHDAGITINIPLKQGLAIKSMLGISWYRLRILNRLATCSSKGNNFHLTSLQVVEASWGILRQ